VLRRKKKEQVPPDDAGVDTAAAPVAGAAVSDTAPGPEGVAQEHDGSGPGDTAVAMAEPPPAMVDEPPAPPPPPSPDPVTTAEPVGSRFGPPPPPPPDGELVERLPAKFYFEGVVKPERVLTRDELERQAEADFRAAIAPSLEALRELVPDASGPEEAMQVLAERQGEALVDEEGANLASRDIYRNETSVYYRIRTHFDKPPRRGIGGGWRPPSGLATLQRDMPSGRRSSR